MAEATETKQPGGESRHACELLLLVAPRVIDPAVIRELVGNQTVPTIKDVARAFGFAPHTVKVNWRNAGMPGKKGRWPLAEILVWRLRRDEEEQTTRGDHSQRVDIELRRAKLRADVDRAVAKATSEQAAAARIHGEWAHVAQVRRVNAQAFAILSRELLKIPRQLIPQLPENLAHQVADDARRTIELALNVAADSIERAILLTKATEAQGDDDDQADTGEHGAADGEHAPDERQRSDVRPGRSKGKGAKARGGGRKKSSRAKRAEKAGKGKSNE